MASAINSEVRFAYSRLEDHRWLVAGGINIRHCYNAPGCTVRKATMTLWIALQVALREREFRRVLRRASLLKPSRNDVEFFFFKTSGRVENFFFFRNTCGSETWVSEKLGSFFFFLEWLFFEWVCVCVLWKSYINLDRRLQYQFHRVGLSHGVR